MTCIAQILEKTDRKPYVIDDYVCIEGGGEYKDYEYLITFVSAGHRCGYVAIKGTESWANNNDYDEIPVEVHGGITFYDDHHSLKTHFNITCPDKWLGFDCAHAYDGKDFPYMKKYGFNKLLKIYRECGLYEHPEETIRDYDYVENECKSVIDQILK